MHGKHAVVPHYRTAADLVKKFHEEGNVSMSKHCLGCYACRQIPFFMEFPILK